MVNGEVIVGNVVAQSHQAIKNLMAIVEEAGYGPEDIVRCGVWLDDARDFAAFNGVFRNISVRIRRHAPAWKRKWWWTVRWKSIAWLIKNRRNDDAETYLLQGPLTDDRYALDGSAVERDRVGGRAGAADCVGATEPFLTLVLCSLGLALASGIPLPKVVGSFEAGMGSTLGHVAIVVALGTMLGKMLTESGAAKRVAETLVDVFGPQHALVGHAGAQASLSASRCSSR